MPRHIAFPSSTRVGGAYLLNSSNNIVPSASSRSGRPSVIPRC
nr:MAG TPA: hypothetical protein [Caudoviricetes sp.]